MWAEFDPRRLVISTGIAFKREKTGSHAQAAICIVARATHELTAGFFFSIPVR